MPIQYGFTPKVIPEKEFHRIDYEVMALVFAIHNDMGRLWNEKIYQNELVNRCRKAGFEKVVTEVPLTVSYQDFQKTYKVDLILNDAVIYELKTVRALTGEHQQQALHYLFLLGLQHGKLINMRPPSVEHRFVSTQSTREKRFDFTVDDKHWQELDEDSVWLKQIMINFLKEWGAFLDTSLFYEAIYHFRGGEERVVKAIEIKNGVNRLGTQKFYLINSCTMFDISSMTKDENYYERHLHRFLHYTPFKATQWINFNHDQIIFKTILK
ncbi:MAG: GxxExxY protein [bacterium]